MVKKLLLILKQLRITCVNLPTFYLTNTLILHKFADAEETALCWCCFRKTWALATERTPAGFDTGSSRVTVFRHASSTAKIQWISMGQSQLPRCLTDVCSVSVTTVQTGACGWAHEYLLTASIPLCTYDPSSLQETWTRKSYRVLLVMDTTPHIPILNFLGKICFQHLIPSQCYISWSELFGQEVLHSMEGKHTAPTQFSFRF